MKRTHLVISVFVVVAIVGLLMAADKQESKGQYARLLFGDSLPYKWNWKEPGFNAKNQSIYALCTTLKINTHPDKADVFTIVNWAGSKGWDLVTMGRIGQENASVIWFKKTN